MKRKLVKQGISTLMISLPIKWIKQNGLDKGSEVDLEEKGKEIIISLSPTSLSEKKISLDVGGFDLLINRILISLYVKGYEEVELIFKDREETKKLKKHVVEELLGFEIIKQTQNKIIIRDLTGFEKQNIDDITKRIFFIIDGMLEDLINSNGKKQDLNDISNLDTSVNKLVHFSLRILNSRGYINQEKTISFYGIISILEQVGDIIKQIINDFRKEKINSFNIELIKKIKSFLGLFEKILFNFNKEDAVKFAKTYEEIKMSIKGKDKIDLRLSQLNETIIRMNNYLLVNVF